MTEPDPGERAGFGLFGSLRRALANLIELAHTRLQLLSVEMEARLLNSRQVMLWSVVALFSASFTMLMLTVTVLIIFWDTHRLLAASLITVFFAILAVAAALMVRHRVRTRPRLLAATINELKSDAAALGEER
jgi:uncharacterized membrane protein YqjE